MYSLFSRYLYGIVYWSIAVLSFCHYFLTIASSDDHCTYLVVITKVDLHEMDCKCLNIHSGVHLGLSVYLWWFIKYQQVVRNTWKTQGTWRGLEMIFKGSVICYADADVLLPSINIAIAFLQSFYKLVLVLLLQYFFTECWYCCGNSFFTEYLYLYCNSFWKYCWFCVVLFHN